MTSSSTSRSGRIALSRLLERSIPVGFAGIGFLLVQWPVVASGFRRVATDMGDTRLVAYFLEHSYLWLAGAPGHAAFWDPPFFFPQENGMAFSEPLLGSAFPYWAARAAGAGVWSSFQAWVVAWFFLDFAAAYGFLRRVFGTGRVAASLGAFIFAFGSPRAAFQGHQQLLPHAFSVWALWAWIRGLREEERTLGALRLASAAALVALQFWSSFYLGCFLAMGLGLGTLAWALRLSAGGRWRPVADLGFRLLVPTAVLALGLAPLAWHYLGAARIAEGAAGRPGRSWLEVSSMLPRLQSWVFLGDESLVYAWLKRIRMFQVIPNEGEQRIGVGFVTWGLALWGLYQSRGRSAARWTLAAAAGAILLTSAVWPGVSLWWFAYRYLPGANALRAVARVGLVVALAWGVGAAFGWDLLARSLLPGWKGRLVLGCLLSAVIAEQGQRIASFEREEADSRVAALVGRGLACHQEPGAPVYFAARPRDAHPPFVQEIDAMWAGLALGRPTVNGYSGLEPKGYPGPAAARSWVQDWLESRGRDPNRLCYLSAS